jgi:hypothetical protein
MFYAAVNSYGTETSVGFANTWRALGFKTRQMRDAFVGRAKDMATRPIKAAELGTYGARAGQVDYYDATGRLKRHVGRGEYADGGESIDPTTAEPTDSWRFTAAGES